MARDKKGSVPTGRRATVRVKTARGRTVSSQRWLQRQLNDPYVEEAKKRGYRSRAAFKLLQIDDQFKILKPGGRIVDLGAAPGGWTQVAVERVSSGRNKGVVIGIDITPVEPIAGATVLAKDFYDDDAPAVLTELLGGPRRSARDTTHLHVSAGNDGGLGLLLRVRPCS